MRGKKYKANFEQRFTLGGQVIEKRMLKVDFLGLEDLCSVDMHGVLR